MDEQRHVALPKLTGAPAYARPSVVPAAPVPRPIGLDDLPLAAQMTEEDMALLAAQESGGASGTGSVAAIQGGSSDGSLQPRPFSLRAFAERIRRPRP